MKPKYIIKVKCPVCTHIDPETYRTKTRWFTGWECPNCHHVMGLTECIEVYQEVDEEKIIDDIYILFGAFEYLIDTCRNFKIDTYRNSKGEMVFLVEALNRIIGRSWRSRFARRLLKIKLI